MASIHFKLSPPTAASAEHAAELVRGLDFESQAEVLQYQPPKPTLASGGGPGGGHLLEWVLWITQHGVWEFLVPFLTGYAGKEFLKGFAGDAGKDFWKGVKNFAGKIFGSAQLNAEEKESIRIETSDNKNAPHFSLVLKPRWFERKDESNRLIEVLESIVLPSLAKFLCSVREGSNSSEIFDVYIQPLRRELNGWRLRVLRRASRWEMEARVLVERGVLEWDTRDGSLDPISESLINELIASGAGSVRHIDIFTRFPS
jgi:hypothetical protein